jgi:hypothetical protein
VRERSSVIAQLTENPIEERTVTRTNRRLALVAAALLILVGAAACGDDDTADASADEASGAASEQLTAAEFLEQGNAICAEGNAEIDAAIDDVELGADGAPTPESLVAVMQDTIIPAVAEQIEGLQALTPPEELEADIVQLLTDAEAALDDMQQQLEADPEGFLDAPDPFEDVNARATELGLIECGEGEGEGGDESAIDEGDAGEQGGADVDVVAYCASVEATNAVEFPSDELLAEYQAVAPDELADEIAIVLPVFNEINGGGASPEALGDPEVQEAIDEILAVEAEICGSDG